MPKRLTHRRREPARSTDGWENRFGPHLDWNHEIKISLAGGHSTALSPDSHERTLGGDTRQLSRAASPKPDGESGQALLRRSWLFSLYFSHVWGSFSWRVESESLRIVRILLFSIPHPPISLFHIFRPGVEILKQGILELA